MGDNQVTRSGFRSVNINAEAGAGALKTPNVIVVVPTQAVSVPPRDLRLCKKEHPNSAMACANHVHPLPTVPCLADKPLPVVGAVLSTSCFPTNSFRKLLVLTVSRLLWLSRLLLLRRSLLWLLLPPLLWRLMLRRSLLWLLLPPLLWRLMLRRSLLWLLLPPLLRRSRLRLLAPIAGRCV